MIKPNMLNKGDTVALVSLSSGVAGEPIFKHRLDIGIQRLIEEFELKVEIMPNALKGIKYLDENPKVRAEDLMNAFKKTHIKAIFCMLGGDDTIRLLPWIDFKIIQDNPKIFLGYSDTTINHFMMYKAGITSFYGPSVLAEFAENGAMHSYTKNYIQKVLFEDSENLRIEPSPQWTSEYLDWTVSSNNSIFRHMIDDSKGYQLLQGKGVVQGTLLGGCLDVFPMLFGTNIWPNKEKWKNCILFLETSEESPSPTNLKFILRGLVAQGIIENINGILFAKPKDEIYYSEYMEVLLQVIGKEANRPQLPILYNINFGHTSPMAILPYGTLAEIDCDSLSIRLLETSVVKS